MANRQSNLSAATQQQQSVEPITREQLIDALNEDLAREYQAIIAYVVYSQVLKGAPYMQIAKELEKHAAEELEHALVISKQIDYLGGMPIVAPRCCGSIWTTRPRRSPTIDVA
jgi:bacterioferritin